ncbi:MAG: methyltransferase domain-containing protein [Desulfobacteraceae bacterium]|nr:methyltransferase domain-containing protein [Desulfobacteraceae bacterium]
MKSDREKWNEKHNDMKKGDKPSDILRKFVSPVNQARALDIAAGSGRNSLFLARQGFKVDAVDISDTGLLKFSGRHEGINAICADLDFFDIAPDTYDLIININFLQRRLFPLILEGLRAGGLLIFETFVELEPVAQQPGSRDYLLRPNELLRAFLPLYILYYEEMPAQPGHKASHVACLAAKAIYS